MVKEKYQMTSEASGISKEDLKGMDIEKIESRLNLKGVMMARQFVTDPFAMRYGIITPEDYRNAGVTEN
ncbi:MAG: hypothetical protein ACXACX_20120 [Candidatus Hodarchaeales archaeon]|jgi:hypothetical protein